MPQTDFTKAFPYCNEWGFRKVDVRSIGGSTDACEADGWETVYVSAPLPNTVWDCVIPSRPRIAVKLAPGGLTKDPTDWEPER